MNEKSLLCYLKRQGLCYLLLRNSRGKFRTCVIKKKKTNGT